MSTPPPDPSSNNNNSWMSSTSGADPRRQGFQANDPRGRDRPDPAAVIPDVAVAPTNGSAIYTNNNTNGSSSFSSYTGPPQPSAAETTGSSWQDQQQQMYQHHDDQQQQPLQVHVAPPPAPHLEPMPPPPLVAPAPVAVVPPPKAAPPPKAVDDDDDVLVDTDEEEEFGDEEEELQALPRITKASYSNANTSTAATLDPNYHSDHGEEDSRDVKQGETIGLHEDVVFITEVEWAADDSNSIYGELATRPKPDAMGDPCGCSMPTVPPPPISMHMNMNSETSNNTNGNGSDLTILMDPNNPNGITTCLPTQKMPVSCMDPSCILFACQEECRSNCEAGRFCGNKRITRREYKDVEVFHAGPKGRGLRVQEDIKKGDFIMEYIGRAVRASYLAKLFQRYKQERRLYIMALDSNVYLDARKKGSVARYINHSCEPNCVVERWKVRGSIRAGIFASQDIPKGTELSFDYQWERKKGRAPTKCHCGAPNCRGTLEVKKSLEEEEFEKSYEGHWKTGTPYAGREIINRSIRILSKEHQQHFYADVCKYDEATRQHLVIYRYDWEEVWEDLGKEEWQILDEDVGQNEFVIAKKARLSSWQQENKDNSSTSAQHNNGGAGMLAQLGSEDTRNVDELRVVQPYLYVQTPIKEAFWAKHLVQRCERNCRVTIQAKQFSRPPMPPDPNDPDAVQKSKTLDESLDGSVWKLSVSGYNVAKACTILEKNVTYLAREQGQQGQILGEGLATGLGAAKKLLSMNRLSSGGASSGALAATAIAQTNSDQMQEVVLPRCIVDVFKRRLPQVRDSCRSVFISFLHSESKSKAFAKMELTASLQSDMYTARDSVWSHLNLACGDVDAPKDSNGICYRDLGFLGGELSGEQFSLLFPDESGGLVTQDCRENLERSSFFNSFQSSQRCSVWVQSETDKGRIDTECNIVGEAVPNSPRKIFFGCNPKDISKLWGLVQTRANEVARGVKYLFLGADRVYQPFMLQNDGKFFDYVKRVTGASVMVDHMTGDHLRIDGRSYLTVHKSGVINLEHDFSESDRVALAEEMVQLQIEIYRDHCIRQQNWIFGRDWSLPTISTVDPMLTESGDKASASAPRLQFDKKTVANSCHEIADITAGLGSNGSIGVGAAIIFYRFVAVVCQQDDWESQLKVREIVLACIFLANKAQKVNKWRRLDAVLEAAYQVFYPGAQFDRSKEEVIILADKVLLAEKEILNALDFDVFWRGTGWLITAAVDGAGVKESVANDAISAVCSGPFLAAGTTLWLKYGVEYLFAVAAGYLYGNIETLCPALSLVPLKVLQAIDLIKETIDFGSASKRSSPHPLFDEGKAALDRRVPALKEACVKCIVGLGNQGTTALSATERTYRLIGNQDCRRHVIQGVPRSLVKDVILARIDGASAESKCNIYIGESGTNDADDIVFEGSWRAVAIAVHVLNSIVSKHSKSSLPASVDISVELDVLNRHKQQQAKVEPGLLSMGNVNTSDGWKDTVQSEVCGADTWGKKTGGKICVAGKLAASSLREVGLRWWIPPQHGPSPTGSICDMFLVRCSPDDLFGGLQKLAESFLGESEGFPKLAGLGEAKELNKSSNERYVAVSMQRWPSEKVENRELEKTKKSKRSTRPADMGMGFSASALQEMQLLNELHSVIPSPQGHPNFVLPVALALPSEEEKSEEEEEAVVKEAEPAASSVADVADGIFSLFRSSEQNESVARREKKMKDFVTGPHLVFQPSPFLLERFVSKKKRKGHDKKFEHDIGPAIFSAWMYDLLSALVHCHTNHVVVRSFQADQVVVDHSGVAKLGGLYRATVISREESQARNDPLKSAPPKASKSSSKKKDRKSRSKDDDEDVTSNPYIAPEHLFGSTKHSKESDVWSLACLLANILLNKTFYNGKDRQSLLNSMYKVVGTPARENFEVCARLPHYSKPLKKYKRGVEKAFQHILKEKSEEHSGAIDLLSKMLHLDPNERITAAEALHHPYMLEYLQKSRSSQFCQRFVEDWMSLKGKMMKATQGQDEPVVKTQENTLKRKAMVLLASASNGNEDEGGLYDMEDILAPEVNNKKPKL